MVLMRSTCARAALLAFATCTTLAAATETRAQTKSTTSEPRTLSVAKSGVIASLPAVARKVITAAKFATFVTTDSAGHPQARTVQPLSPDSQWVVWMATNPRTRKVGEVQRDPHVALHYFDHVTESYVTLIGNARIVKDRATKDAHWDSAWNSFYPDRDTSVVLIEVRTQRLEVVSPKLGVNSDPATWRPPSMTVGRER